ncbi:hypothetical protein CLM85_08025 [Streptomyces albidoflavus]|uniref:hypothetical protein n=1 Tax=Streptomyces albidoflavus TaxID=1886 RepID=UPI000BAE34DC|nr:hypothetical protein [Streptomyces albidoflavus]PAX86074.1 hypothetical protein CLM81_10610 [Streptomyces albidoflavus]PAX89749.1 hypothetical protein CLM82_19435 [Streptomyces albidoflavus]PBO15111.1 hypothetical protein CLM83_32075 [Streptomyces albidoflavus]PBO24808.1 hypothetical protein CLM85_08025 [Streptomyces albidoflavus]PBO28708.1 hypothetical protein CLM84_18430 [Streptomyces albidoflavus]
MSRGGGRPAAVPSPGTRPRPRTGTDGLTVRFVPEDPSDDPFEFDFRPLPLSPLLQRTFAAAFAERIRPGAGLRSWDAAKNAFEDLRTFARVLSRSPRPPLAAAHLVPAHLEEWILERGGAERASRATGRLKLTLKKIEGLDAAFLAKINERTARRVRTETRNYSLPELKRITAAARRDIRAAALRIRANRDLLEQWRQGRIDADADPQAFRRGRLLDHVDRHGDVPRYPGGRRAPMRWAGDLGKVGDHMTALHLGLADATAFVVLLVAMTGENGSTVMRAPAAHFRADGYAGGPATAIVGLDKRRRAANRYRDAALVDLPSWIPLPDKITEVDPDRVPLNSPFAVYSLMVELGAPARTVLNTDRLVVWWSPGGGGGAQPPGLREAVDDGHIQTWAARRDLPADQRGTARNRKGPPPQLNVTMSRLRLSQAELNQKPASHTEATLANEYLLRNRGNLDEYRRVVAAALEAEAGKARTRGALQVLTDQDIEQARVDPPSVAKRYGLDAIRLKELIAGELDTVMTGCTDHTGGPHAPAGEPCRASFMLCLSCPCARAAPHHLPFQVLVHDALDERRRSMTPLKWSERFALPFTQLTDLLERAGQAPVEQARSTASEDQKKIVQRFLNREMDLR